jgi:hypothetical protein
VKPRAAFAAAAGVCFLGLFVATAEGLPTVRPVPSHAPTWNPGFDMELQRAFAQPVTRDTAAPYETVFRYLLTSFVDRERPSGDAVDQPGAPSRHGRDVDALEGFARLAPLIAAWLAGGRSPHVVDLRGRDIDLTEWLRRGLVSGPRRDAPGYWGDIADLDQRIVEAADIARAVWIARNFVLPKLSEPERAALFTWLRQVDGRRVSDNNWHLYPVIINQVLHGLGQPWDERGTEENFARFWSFYRGQGWFQDGPDPEAVDWYNAWAMQYELTWLARIAPDWHARRIDDVQREFLKTFPYLIGPQGVPIMGRSICYRLAAPTPLVAAGIGGSGAEAVPPGMARHALDDVWRYFVGAGAFRSGVITQGYCGVDLRLLDNYSGPSSCLWSLRALTLAFLAGPGDAFWTAPERPLPIDVGSYDVQVRSIGWRIVGNAATKDIRILKEGASPDEAPAGHLESFGFLRRLVSSVLHHPIRPENNAAKYRAAVYSSATPFCGCAPASEPGS